MTPRTAADFVPDAGGRQPINTGPAVLFVGGFTAQTCSPLAGASFAASFAALARAEGHFGATFLRRLRLPISAHTAAPSEGRCVNAAVVGLLGAALYNPVWTSSVKTPGDFGIVLVGFVLLTVWRAPPLLVVVMSALAGARVMGDLP